MTECEWDEDLPGPDGCGTSDSPAEAVAVRQVAWTTRIWGGEGEDWEEDVHLCAEHAAVFDAKMAEVAVSRYQLSKWEEMEG